MRGKYKLPLVLFVLITLLWGGVSQGQSEQPDKYLDKVILKNGSVLWGLVESRDQELIVHIKQGSDIVVTLDEVKIIKKNKLNPNYFQKRDSGRFYRLNTGLLLGKNQRNAPNEASFNFSFTAGHKFNTHLGGGVGTGLYHYPEVRHLPVYAEASGDLLNTRLTPAYFVRMGWSWAFEKDEVEDFVDDIEGGFFLEPGMALKLYLPNRILELAVSYVRQNSTTVWDPVEISNGSFVHTTTETTFQRINLTVGITL